MARSGLFPDVFRDTSGRSYHVKAKNGELNGYIMTAGSPDRINAAKELIEEAKLVSSNRGLIVYNGVYKGTPVTLFCSGMGPSSAEISYTEVISNVDTARFRRPTIIRAGTAASWSPKVSVNDIAVELGVVRSDGTSSKIAPLEWPAKTDLITTLMIAETAHDLGLDERIWFGTGICKDTLYAEESPETRSSISADIKEGHRAYDRMGAISASMESSPMALLTDFYNRTMQGSGVRLSFASALLIVSPYYLETGDIQFKVDEGSEMKLVTLALESLAKKMHLDALAIDGNSDIRFDLSGAIKVLYSRTL